VIAMEIAMGAELLASAHWVKGRGFFVSLWRGDRTVSQDELAATLFAWDEPSRYGSLLKYDYYDLDLDSRIRGRMPFGVWLKGLEAAHYFVELPVNRLAKFTWSDEAQGYIAMAPGILNTLRRGRFMPDYSAMKRGSLAWRKWDVDKQGGLGRGGLRAVESQTSRELAAAVDAPLIVLENEWITLAIQEVLDKGGDVQAQWNRLVEAFPALTDLQAFQPWDEQDWLEHIGWQRNDVPFCIGLRLDEPVGGEPWTLQVVLRDSRDESNIVEYTPSSQWSVEPEAPQGVLAPARWQEHQHRADREVRRWLQAIPWLADATGALRQSLSSDEAWEFMSNVSLQLASMGCFTLLPKWWADMLLHRTKLRARVQSSVGSSGEHPMGIEQIVQFDWRISVGNADLSDKEFLELVDMNQRLVYFRGQWVEINPVVANRIRRTIKRWQRSNGLTLSAVLGRALLPSPEVLDAGVGAYQEPVADTGDEPFEVELNRNFQDWLSSLQRVEKLPEVRVSSRFHGSLRHYQEQGVSWLRFLRTYGLGACLADDMGLGKTIELIAYLLNYPGPSLIVCPTSVLGNWQKELIRFAPDLSVYVHHGQERCHGEVFAETVRSADVILTSYALVHFDIEDFLRVQWDTLALDEAQAIKNAYGKQTQSIRKLKATHRIAMTGTPLENRLTELWSIFDFLNPGYLGSLRQFAQRFARPVEKGDSLATDSLRRLVQPFLLRRTKTDLAVGLELPEKTEMKVYVPLTGRQAVLYESVLQDMMAKLEEAEGMARRGLILSTLTKLKQVCNHPALVTKQEGQLRDVRQSAKLCRLLEMVEELREEGDRCLIFTQFVETGRLLQRTLDKALSEPILFLHGGTPKAERDRLIERFQQEEGDANVFILSIKAGGIGLNLTAANHVFHFDRWWNPAVENQATDRAYRIGQHQAVQVHKFVALGTLEERIDEMLEKKQGLADQIVGGTGEQWITELSTAELRNLFTLRREWIEE